MAVKAGATTTSRSSKREIPVLSSSAKATASAMVKCIFQFPAMRGVRALILETSSRTRSFSGLSIPLRLNRG
jgi:hypothetical protein